MDYSLNKRTVRIGGRTGQEVYVATPVCQKEQISFEALCARMSEDSTVGEADIAAVFYKMRKVLNELCSMGYIVNAGPLGKFRPTFKSLAAATEEEFKPSTSIIKTQILFTPTPEFKRLRNVEFHRVEKAKPKKAGGSAP